MLTRVPGGKGQLVKPSPPMVNSKMLSSNTHSSVANRCRLVILWTFIDPKILRYSCLTVSRSRWTSPRAGTSQTMPSVDPPTARSMPSMFSLWKCWSTAAMLRLMISSRVRAWVVVVGVVTNYSFSLGVGGSRGRRPGAPNLVDDRRRVGGQRIGAPGHVLIGTDQDQARAVTLAQVPGAQIENIEGDAGLRRGLDQGLPGAGGRVEDEQGHAGAERVVDRAAWSEPDVRQGGRGGGAAGGGRGGGQVGGRD